MSALQEQGRREAAPVAHGGKGARSLARIRAVTVALVFCAVIASLAFDLGLGTPSSFGIGSFFLLCPLGGIEAMIANHSIIPVSLISLAVVAIICLALGRSWCAWCCPVPPLRKFFGRNPEPAQPSERCAAAQEAVRFADKMRHIGRDKRTWVLVAVLVATLVAGLPLFCLVCPIGLTFGTVGSLWHLIVDKQVTASVVVFPAALVVEILVCRTWCMSVCPVAGLLNIFGQFAVLFRPRVNESTCMNCAQGAHCNACVKACPEHIDLHAPDAAIQLGECTRCGECVAHCPTGSVSMRVLPEARNQSED